MKKKSEGKIFSFILAAALMLGVFAMPPQTAYAAMPTSAAGQPYDGVDFAALFPQNVSGSKVYSGIYYGTYDHKTSTGRESDGSGPLATPILWRVMGEEKSNGTGDGYITLMSEYVLDSMQFHVTSNKYENSSIQTSLALTFMNSFTDAEKLTTNMIPTNVVTQTYVLGSVNTVANPDNYGSTATGQQAYLPWGLYEGNRNPDSDDSIFWSANGTISAIEADNENNTIYRKANGTANEAGKAYYKNESSTARHWWLRSPSSIYSHDALIVHSDGVVNNASVHNALGVRPAFKLNPSSVIFTSEIKTGADTTKGETVADGSNYSAAAGGAKNFKLTVVSASGNTLGNVPNAPQTVENGEDLDLTGLAPSQTGGDYTINYKIVGESAGIRTIQSYGFTAAVSSTNLTLDTSGLADGDYTAYVWLQKNNAINSHEASAVGHFALTVEDTTAPTLSAGSVSRTSDTEATVKFTSDEAGTYYYQLDGTAPADADALVAAGTNAAAMIAAEQTVTLTSLAAGEHTTHIAAKDAADNISNMLTITIPAYVPPPPNTYYLTVVNGTDNTGGSPYTAGMQVSITANAAPAGQAFDYWSSNSGGSFANAGSAATTFTMPAATVTVTAHYKNTGGSYTGGDSGSYTPPVIWNIVTDKQPNLPKTATLAHSGTVTNSRLTFTITKAMVQAALDKAGKDPDGIGLIFNITGSGFTAQTITFEDAAIDLLKSSKVKFVQVQTGMFRFKFDDKAIAQLDAQTAGPVSVNANPAKLNAEAKKLIGSRPALDVTVQFRKDGKTWNVVSFGSGTMTRWIAYKLAAGESAGNLAAVYVDKSGSPSWIEDSVFDNGWLGWAGNTNSVYGVGLKTPAPAFTDTAGHWGKDNIDFAVSRGYMGGTSATTFSPNTVITRGMFITALGRLSGADVSGYDVSSFYDVAAGSYYLPYTEWAVENKIVQGVGGGRFAPESPIAREDMAVMMVNFAKAMNYKLPVALEAFKFTDAASVAGHAKDAVTAVQQAGIVVGKSGGVFDPKGNLTRAEACTVLRRFVETVIDPASARGWAQNDSGQWMYYGLTSGKLMTGWQIIGGEKYYFDANGAMQADKWVQIEGKRYYFYPDGTLAVSAKIDGYEVGADGARK